MVILAIDTSSAATSVAITDGSTVLASAVHVDARRHAELLAPMIVEVRNACGSPRIDAVAVGVGPGPYTGLRVGIATAQALALAWQVSVVGLCSLDVLAAQAVADGLTGAFLIASDARRREVYWASYEDGIRMDGPYVQAPAAVPEHRRLLPATGEGAHLHAGHFGAVVLPEVRFPQAQTLGALAGELLAAGHMPAAPRLGLSAHGSDDGATARSIGRERLLTASPLYVRRPDAAEPVVGP